MRRIVLTQEQIDEFDLPVSPIDGVSVELDALEAVRPGEFERIVEGHIARYQDPDLDDRVEERFEDFKAEIEATNEEAVTEVERAELELDRRCQALAAEFNERLAPLDARAAELFAGIRSRLAEGGTPVFEPPVPEAEDPDDDDPLFDSDRDYLEPLEGYGSGRDFVRRPSSGLGGINPGYRARPPDLFWLTSG